MSCGLQADLVSPNRWAFPLWTALKFSRQTTAVLMSFCAQDCLTLTSFYLTCIQSAEPGTTGICRNLQGSKILSLYSLGLAGAGRKKRLLWIPVRVLCYKQQAHASHPKHPKGKGSLVQDLQCFQEFPGGFVHNNTR